MTKPLALFLADFGRPALPLPGLPSFAVDEVLDLPAGPDLDERLAEARAEGFAEGEVAGRAAAGDEIEALGAAHAVALADARRSWVAGQGDTLAELIREGLGAIETALADAVAAALEPVVGEGVRAKAVAEMRDAVATLLAGERGAPVRVTGPADLVEALRTALGPAQGVEFAADDAVELVVLAGDTTIRSALQPWAERLRPSLGEER